MLTGLALTDKITNDTYDDRDLRRLRTDDVYVTTFIRGPNRLDEGVELVHESLRFRKEFGINGKKLKSVNTKLTDNLHC